jgi:SAM-dependent methyltransferase
MQLTGWDSYYSKEITVPAFVASSIYHWPYIWQVYLKAKNSAIEIGCGRGIHAIFLSYFIRTVVGIDKSPALIERAKVNNAKLRGRARFLIRDAFNLDFPADTFDVCFSQGFFEHFTPEEIGLLTKEQLRVARAVVASIPSTFYSVKDRGDEHLLSIEEWKNILKEFRTHLFYYGFTPRDPHRLISVKNLLDFTKLLSSKSYRAHLCMLIKRKKETSIHIKHAP